MQSFESINLISTDPNVRNGRPCIAGTGIEVSAIAITSVVHMQSPEQIASDYRLNLAQVHAALAYYYDHREAIDESIRSQEEMAEQLKEQIFAKQTPLLHRRKSDP
jgi:uncharacterized protein (DUF433 family)